MFLSGESPPCLGICGLSTMDPCLGPKNRISKIKTKFSNVRPGLVIAKLLSCAIYGRLEKLPLDRSDQCRQQRRALR